jgi:hypothetical protein
MTECNGDQCPVVVDSISSTSDDDDYSLSTIDPYYDLFELGIDEHGDVFFYLFQSKSGNND